MTAVQERHTAGRGKDGLVIGHGSLILLAIVAVLSSPLWFPHARTLLENWQDRAEEKLTTAAGSMEDAARNMALRR